MFTWIMSQYINQIDPPGSRKAQVYPRRHKVLNITKQKPLKGEKSPAVFVLLSLAFTLLDQRFSILYKTGSAG